MRWILSALLLAGSLSAAHVQTIKAPPYTTPTTTPTVTISPSAGSLLVVGCIVSPTGAAPTFTVSDDRGNSWSRAVQGAPGFSGSWSYEVALEIWYAPNVAAGSTTITCGLSTSSYVTLIVSEHSGMATSNVLDGTPDRVGGSSATPTSGSITTTNANDLIVSLLVKTGTSVISAGSGYTIRQKDDSEDAVSGALEDRSVTSAGAYTAGFSLGASTNWYMLTAAFKQSGGGPPPSTRRRIVVMQ